MPGRADTFVVGTITRYLLALGAFDPTYAADDPRSWRDQCDDETKPLKEYLDSWRAPLQNLEWILHFQKGDAVLLYAPESPKEAEVGCPQMTFTFMVHRFETRLTMRDRS